MRTVDLKAGIVRTVAGNGEKGVPADGQDALTQPLVDPRAIAVDTTGRLYILERNGHALRVVDRNGKIRTVAGNGTPGFSGDGGPAREALLRGPKHISIDQDDSVLIADTENHVIRRYSPRTGLITRVAGTGAAGASGVGGPAAAVHAQPSARRADASGHARDLHLRQRQSPRAARRAALSSRFALRQRAERRGAIARALARLDTNVRIAHKTVAFAATHFARACDTSLNSVGSSQAAAVSSSHPHAEG